MQGIGKEKHGEFGAERGVNYCQTNVDKDMGYEW